MEAAIDGLADAAEAASCPAAHEAAPAVIPVTLAFAFLCCLCGYLAFLYLAAQERSNSQKAASKPDPPRIDPPLSETPTLSHRPACQQLMRQHCMC